MHHRHPLVRVAAVLAAAALCLGFPASASAGPTPSPTGAAQSAGPAIGPEDAGTAVCTVSNNQITEITGMVATNNGIYVVEGGNEFAPNAVAIWTIDPASCAATSRNYGFTPVDPQDLTLGSDGALWVGDIGDGIGSDNQRRRIALERVQVGGSASAVPYRANYPDSGKFAAQAMLLQKNDVPIIFVNVSGKVLLYTPSAALQPNADTDLPKLTKVGEFTPAKTNTKNPLGAVGNVLVTGAARSSDGTKVVLRTASDAYEFTIGADGDMVKTITTGTPVITRLPGEENGQAITYSADGKSFLTLSMVPKPVLRQYTPYVPAPAAPAGAGGDRQSSGGGTFSFSDLTLIAGSVSFLGFATMVTGIVGIVLARRKAAAAGVDLRGQRPRRDPRDPHERRRPPPRDRERPRRDEGRWDDDQYRDDGQHWDGNGHDGGWDAAPPPPPPPSPPPPPPPRDPDRSRRPAAAPRSQGRGQVYGGGQSPASSSSSGGGSTYRSSARVDPPPAGPPPQGPHGGQLYGGGDRYRDDDAT